MDTQVVAYIRSRYSDFVLLRPPLTAGTVLLPWIGPAVILPYGAFGVRALLSHAGAQSRPRHGGGHGGTQPEIRSPAAGGPARKP